MPRFRKDSAGHAAGLRRPEIVWHQTSGGGPRGDARRRSRSGRNPGGRTDGRPDIGRDDEHRWSLIDIGAMILAALQVILPFVVILLAATGAAYGLFILAFARGG
ncbi:MAG: hypothetical protein GVY23_01825 [Spirochaetes bacterium]|nr:hypothetical protein [Spirochaetota bacterium]